MLACGDVSQHAACATAGCAQYAAVAAGCDITAGPCIDLGDLSRAENALLLNHHAAGQILGLLVRPNA